MNELILMKIGTSGRRGKYTSDQLWGHEVIGQGGGPGGRAAFLMFKLW